MENQHRKIAGYRELSAEEIDLMNRIKEKGAELIGLNDELERHIVRQGRLKQRAAEGATRDEAAIAEFELFLAAEPGRWNVIGKTDIQTGIMAMVRAVAQPGGGI